MNNRILEDIKILDKMIERHERAIKKSEKEKGVTTATIWLGKEVINLTAAKMWLKVLEESEELKGEKGEEKNV